MAPKIADIVSQATAGNSNQRPRQSDENEHSVSSATTTPRVPRLDTANSAGQSNRISYHKSQPSTPSMRTGPPRSLSYVYSLPNSPSNSRTNSRYENGDIPPETNEEGEEFPFSAPTSEFRGALEVGGSMSSNDKKGKKRESRFLDDAWNPMKWFHESPREEKDGFEFGEKNKEDGGADVEEDKIKGPSLRRTRSDPHHSSLDRTSRAKWGRLRSLLPQMAQQGQNTPASPHGASAVTSHTVNITDELITGGLSTLMLRLWFERDEKGQRRVPVLLHRLRIRVSDSIHPLHGHKSVFRIECEYANGAVRWVIYRQLRDFLSLHTHYAVSNAYNRNVDNLPEFPRTSLPYFKFLLKERGREVGQAEFARLQRQTLENYLLDLIRAVMFHPASNRLCGFLEISALSIAHAQTGGTQYKAGYLQIEASDNRGGGFGRKGTSWKSRRESRWCAVRESYLVVMEEPGELTVWDVFLLDSDFSIERPKRYYRQGLHLLHPDSDDEGEQDKPKENRLQRVHSEPGRSSIVGTIKGNFSRIFGHGRAKTSPGGAPHDGDDSDSSSESSVSFHQNAPMLDPSTNVNPLAEADENQDDQDHPWTEAKKKKKANANEVSKHTFFISNSQMRLKLYAKNQRQMLQWITALERVAATSHYTGRNRFDSFAPIRLNVAAQWLVDGRDYFWNLSRAILMAKETIYIHDWWLSPELYLRRPNKEHYRLDRLLERKAKEGVKVFIILYQEVSSRTTPTDSNYTKQRMTSLHPNIMVQRSPSHFQTGTFYWAHHEKLCVIDQAIAFMGGLDLCFGRWDTPQHVLIDDVDAESGQPQIWPGKDYSNARVSDFYNLSKPEEDMYDRTKVGRMPWHDVAMQVVGQPARDLARHFVERWNYLLRIKNHKRTMPFLLPPPEFKPGELTQMGLTGTCEMQVCRSAGPWSLGTPNRIEHSIQNAYLKAIQMSEHFVYIENQFFISSTTVNDIKIENRIGDAIVHRILRAHRDEVPWKCCIIIPVLPGFAFPVDHSDASAVRIILECQNRTFARGPNSIFARLRKEGIDPNDYITVFSLRNWGKLRGDILTTEQVYIHGKVCIVDDRLAIIGSANINERSQRGDRDSELAAIIRDTDMIDGTMAGKPFKVGRFAHTLRIRLMREHLGVDVDTMYEEDLMTKEPAKAEHDQEPWDPDTEQQYGRPGVTKVKKPGDRTATRRMVHTFGDGITQAVHATTDATSGSTQKTLSKMGLVKDAAGVVADDTLNKERTTFTRDGKQEPGFTSSMVPTLEEQVVAEHNSIKGKENGNANINNSEVKGNGNAHPQARVEDGELYGAPAGASTSEKTDNQPPHSQAGAVDDADEDERAAPGARSLLRKHLGSKLGSKTWTLPTPRPKVDPEGFDDPVSDAFWKNVWVASAVHNTEIYRKVFHAVPDDLVTTWKQYKEFVLHHERLNKPPRDSSMPEAVGRVPSETGDESVPLEGKEAQADEQQTASKEGAEDSEQHLGNSTSEKDPKTRKPAKGVEPFEKWERDEMEKLLGELNGHLVLYPTRFLEGEDAANNFLFNADRLLPLPIYD